MPVFHVGTGTLIRGSNVDSEVRADFYAARAVVLYFGSPRPGSADQDHWALPELKHALASRVDCLIYVSEDYPRSVLIEHGYAGEPTVILAERDFGSVLKEHLEALTET